MAKKTGKTCSKVFTQYHQRNDWGSIFSRMPSTRSSSPR